MNGSCTCQPAIRVKSRQHALELIWQSDEWKERVKAFLKYHPFCHYCGRPATVPHHVTDETYGKPAYLDLERHCIPLCGKCHFHYRRGYVICPVCLANGEYHYMMAGRDKCSRHQAFRPKGKYILRHPCANNYGNQICRRAGGQTICARSPRNAAGCDWFTERAPL